MQLNNLLKYVSDNIIEICHVVTESWLSVLPSLDSWIRGLWDAPRSIQEIWFDRKEIQQMMCFLWFAAVKLQQVVDILISQSKEMELPTI